MTDANVSLLVEAKAEYTRHIVQNIWVHLLDGIIAIYNRAKDVCQRKNEPNMVILTFQQLLSAVPDWNTKMVEAETASIVKECGCDYFADLITAVFVCHTKILSFVRVHNQDQKINLNLPTPSGFVHEVYIELAREFWKQPFLLYEHEDKVRYQKQLYMCQILIERCIENTIRRLLPVRSILQKYLTDPDAEDVARDDVASSKGKKTNKPASGADIDDEDSDSDSDDAQETREESTPKKNKLKKVKKQQQQQQLSKRELLKHSDVDEEHTTDDKDDDDDGKDKTDGNDGSDDDDDDVKDKTDDVKDKVADKINTEFMDEPMVMLKTDEHKETLPQAKPTSNAEEILDLDSIVTSSDAPPASRMSSPSANSRSIADTGNSKVIDLSGLDFPIETIGYDGPHDQQNDDSQEEEKVKKEVEEEIQKLMGKSTPKSTPPYEMSDSGTSSNSVGGSNSTAAELDMHRFF